MYNRLNECCKYRERKLALKKKNKVLNKALNKDTSCEEKDTSFETRRTKCPKNNDKKVVKVQTSFFSETDDLISRIKPSISEREKYFNPNHVICFLEGIHNRNMLKQTTESETCIDKRKTSKKRKGKDKDKEKDKDKVWCETTVHESLSNSIIECDSICSFDSIIDLAGLALTTEEEKQIEKKREEASQEGRKKKKELNKKELNEKELNEKDSNEKELNEEELNEKELNETELNEKELSEKEEAADEEQQEPAE